MSAITAKEASATVIVTVAHLQGLAVMGVTKTQQDTASKLAAELQGVAGLIKSMDADLTRLRRIEAAALRVASSRRGGIVTDQAPLDALDEALEASC